MVTADRSSLGWGSRGLPVVGKQFTEPGDGVARDAPEHVAKPGKRLDDSIAHDTTMQRRPVNQEERFTRRLHSHDTLAGLRTRGKWFPLKIQTLWSKNSFPGRSIARREIQRPYFGRAERTSVYADVIDLPSKLEPASISSVIADRKRVGIA